MEAAPSSTLHFNNQSLHHYIYVVPEWFEIYEEFQTIFISALHVGSILIGGFIVLTMALARRLHSASNMVLTSLTLADMLVAILFTVDKYFGSGTERGHRSWVAGTIMNTALTQFPILVTHLHSVVIAAERHFAVTRPMRYGVIWTPRTVGSILAATWGMGALLTSTVIGWGAIWESPQVGGVPTVRSLLTAIVCYGVGATVVAALYGRILAVARQQRRKIQQMQLHAIHLNSDSEVRPMSTSQQSRGSRLFSSTVAAIFLCWGPFFAVTIAIEFTEPVELWHYALQGMMLCFAFTNYLFNFAIYICISEDFRKASRLMIMGRVAELRQG